ncbi:MAG: N-acetylmuramoyl-L-alanine amidase [Dysgonamonadaceae bacterium]
MESARITIYLLLSFLIFSFILLPVQAQERTFKVVIDPGHGGKDPGALGASSKEKDIVLSVAKKIGNMIQDHHNDVEIIYTRDRDNFIELNKRAEIANKKHADLFISLHCNALSKKQKSPQGVETYVLGLHRSNDNLDVAKAENAVILYEEDYSITYQGFNPSEPESYIIFEFMANRFLQQSVDLATLIQHQLVNSSKRINRDVRQAGFLVLREVAMPSVLIELGYISNPTDENYLKSASGQESIAKSIFNAFRNYKREYDKKSYVFNTDKSSQQRTLSTNVEETQVAANDIEYRIQLFVSSNKYKENASIFKGLKPITYYQEGAIYKYTYGSSTNKNDIENELRGVRKSFKDAFIVDFKDGKRIK